MYKIHVPVEQYGFVEQELPSESTPEDAKLAYNEIKAQFGMQVPQTEYDTLRTKEFNAIIDQYLNTGTMQADDYTHLNPLQKQVVQVIKRAFKRGSK